MQPFLLPAYITLETTRALLSFAAIRSHISISPTIISFCSELLKLVFALVFLRLNLIADGRLGDVSSIKAAIAFAADTKSPWRSYWPFAVPAALYLVNNILYLIGLQLTTPAVLHVAVLAKLPVTGILHHFVLKKQRNVYAWVSLTCICAGLLVCNVPIGLFSGWFQVGESGIDAADSPAKSVMMVGPLIGLVIAVLSAVASIFTEVIIKQDIAFMVAQVWLYSYGTLFAGLTLLFWDGPINNSPPSTSEATAWVVDVYAAVIMATAATGLVVANILRKADNLVKLVGTSATIVTIIVAQVVLFPDLRAETVQVHTTLGVGIIAISTWTYNHYKSVQPKTSDNLAGLYEALSHDHAEEGEAKYVDSAIDSLGKSKDGSFELPVAQTPEMIQEGTTGDLVQKSLLKPNWKTVVIASLTVAWLTHITSLYAVHTTPALPPRYGSTDVDRFFVPRNITPAIWGTTPSPTDCIQEWVEREQVYPLTSKFIDWETTFLDSGCPVYPVPDGGLVFHVYWDGPWRPFNELPIETFLATQRLGDGHRLIYWYENGEPTLAVRRRWTTGEYGKYVEFRRFDRVAEAAGYCVESMPEYMDKEYQTALEMPKNTMSDIVRVLLLAKYGGIWLDSDSMLMKDMTSMIRSGPSVPWFGDTRHNNNLLVFGPPDSEIGDKVLEVVCKMSYNETVFHEEFPTITPTVSWTCKWLSCLLYPSTL